MKDFVQKQCRKHVSEEWEKVDDQKICKLRGILSALQEENQATQLLKKESENAEAMRELDTTRVGVEGRLRTCKMREEQFEHAQEELRRRVLENEKSLLELETNIDKGEKKSKDEQADCRRLDQEIQALERDLEEKEILKALEHKKISQTAHHKTFLESVCHDARLFGEDFGTDIENIMNRHNTLEAGNQELHETSEDLTERLDSKRQEAVRVRSKLESDRLIIGSQLHECQVSLEQHRGETREMDESLNRALAEKEGKESEVGIIQMAIEQLFTRSVSSCRLKPRKKAMLDATEQFHGHGRADLRLEEMLTQIIERIQDLDEMQQKAVEALRQDQADEPDLVEESDMLERVQFIQERVDRPEGRLNQAGDDNSEPAG